jgi:hypothetical protein
MPADENNGEKDNANMQARIIHEDIDKWRS